MLLLIFGSSYQLQEYEVVDRCKRRWIGLQGSPCSDLAWKEPFEGGRVFADHFFFFFFGRSVANNFFFLAIVGEHGCDSWPADRGRGQSLREAPVECVPRSPLPVLQR